MMSGNKVWLLCRYGGNLVEESGKVSYKDGTNRMILLGAQEINYPRLLSKVLEVCKCSNIGSIKYKHPELGLDCLVSLENDDDLCNMMQAFETQNNDPIQLFVSEAQQSLPIHDTIPSLIWSSIDEEIAVLTEENRGGRKEMPLQNNSNMYVNAETAGMPTDLQVGVDEFRMDSHDLPTSNPIAEYGCANNKKRKLEEGQEFPNASEIEKLCEDIRRTNSGSRVNLQSKSTENNHLKLFISYEAAVIPVFQMACQPVVRLISVKLKAKSPFFWFMAVGIDTDMKWLLLACGFIELDGKEDVQDGYKWFCCELFSILGGETSNLVFIVEYRDEGGAMEVVRAIFPHSHCRYNHESFFRRISGKFGNLASNPLLGAMDTWKQSEFETWMSKMYEHCPEAWEFLRNINPEYWATSHFKGACGALRLHFFKPEEYIAIWFKDWGHKSAVSVVVLVKHLHNYMMETFTERVKTSSGWTTVLLPSFETYSSKSCKVQILEPAATFTPTRFRVSSDYSEEDVGIDIRNCSCGHWQIFGRPCWNAEEVIKKFQLNRYEYWDECYKTDQYRKAYSMALEVIHPLPGLLEKNKRVSKMLEVIFP